MARCGQVGNQKKDNSSKRPVRNMRLRDLQCRRPATWPFSQTPVRRPSLQMPAYPELTPSLHRPSARRQGFPVPLRAAAYAGAYANLRCPTPTYAASRPIPAVAHGEVPCKRVLEDGHMMLPVHRIVANIHLEHLAMRRTHPSHWLYQGHGREVGPSRKDGGR